MARYADIELLKENFAKRLNQYDGILIKIDDAAVTLGLAVADTPTADVVEIETLRSWLYSIATNNMGSDIKMNLSEACEDIISRLDGLRMFAKEMKIDVPVTDVGKKGE